MMATAFDLDSFAPQPVESLKSDDEYRQAMASSSQGLLIALYVARGVPCPVHLLTKAPVQVFRKARYAFSPFTPLAERTIPLAVRRILEGVAREFDISTDELLGHSRAKYLVYARCVAARLIRERCWENGEPKHSTTVIGRIMNRDHSTICHTLRNFEMYRKRVPEVAAAYDALREKPE